VQITFICNEYPPRPHAGIGTFVQGLARGMSARGHRVSVVGLGDQDEAHNDGPIQVKTLRRVQLRYIGNLLSRLRLKRWLKSQVDAGQVDIVEAPDCSGLLPFGIQGCAAVIRLHLSFSAESLLLNKRVSKGIFQYERRTLSKHRNWIGVSNYILGLTKSVFHVSPERSTMIHNFVPPAPAEMSQMPTLPRDYLLYAGLVGERKGALVLAQAAREVLASRPDLHLVFAGGILAGSDGRPVSEKIEAVVGPELRSRVHFLGHLDRAKTLACMRGAKLLALPSRLESFGLVVLEAMSCGTPVVYTKHPPGPELVEDGVTGLLADPESPQDLGDKIKQILDNPTLAARLGSKAREVVAEKFSLEKCVAATETFYQQCLTN
jgi:glycosyltransferase involved in cell wall biosynthesis